ncbi:MAG TPA: PadR family transcriptional regulator [Edaphocola sp.]|nr:PadR family transcriptional regulator [Edaphocola sp.]
MNVDNMQSQMRKGVLEYCIMAIIRQREVYPSEILELLKGAGLNILEGTLYPLLTRLKNSGLLQYRWEESSAGPPRKYFSITEDGLRFYEALEETWSQLSTAVNNIINAKSSEENE